MADKLYGYFGKMLEIDLTSGEKKEIPLDKSTAQKYVGGIGLAGRIIYDNVPAGTDPLSPQNVLVFPCGPTQGTGVPWSNRWVVSALSPETGFWGRASSGGAFGPALKQCGYDALIFKGKAPKPVYLHITEDFAELKDATHLWGKDTFDTEEEIRRELRDPDVRIACIGQAGENLVRFAAVMNDRGRAAGRTGMGAVMGSKNLKAIAASGHLDVEVADPKRLFRIMKGLIEFGKDGPIGAILGAQGTAFGGVSGPLLGAFAATSHYWTESELPENVKELTLKMVQEHREMFVNNFHCEYCPTGCGGHIKMRSPEKWAFEGHRWEYEAAASFGQECDIYDIKAVAKAGDMCNRYGLDVISCGGLIAFAMMCRERKWLSQKDTGVDLKFGNTESMVEMVKMIAFREGFGNVLAEGIKPAAEKVGHNSIRVAKHCKGLPPGFGGDPRLAASSYLAWSVSPRGACHLYGAMGLLPTGYHMDKGRAMDPHSFKGAARGLIGTEPVIFLLDSMPICFFSMSLGLDLNAGMISAVTGWNVDAREAWRTGDRIKTMVRLLNCKFGIKKEDDIFNPTPAPRVEGFGMWSPSRKELMKGVEEYYLLNGWTKEGIPTSEKIAESGIDNIRENLPNREAKK
jgi:aldehyde:ferredoxin oxidoreductase